MTLEITDSGPGVSPAASRVIGSGQGLAGMRERVALCGGLLEAGPRPGGGYRVHARLPATSAEQQPAAPAPPPSLAQRSSRLVGWPDVVFAAASLVALEATALSYGQHHGWLALNLSVLAAISLASVGRRRMPLLFVAVAGGLGLVVHGLTPANQATLAGTYIVLVPVYTVAAWARTRIAIIGLALWLAGAAGAGFARHASVSNLMAVSLVACLAWIAGWLVRSQRDLAERLHVVTSQLAAEREHRTRLAVAEERTRLARDLQHLVAQLIVAMVVQAEAAASLLDRGSGQATEAISAIETTGREALGQMRHILGVLRSSPAGHDPRPQPGLAQPPTLIGKGALV